MVLFSPPVVNESNPLALFSSESVQTCHVITNSAAAIILVDSTGNPSFMGTFTMYISDKQSEGQYTVSCRVSSADGMVTANETTFSVLGNYINA
jgi:methionine-rich copper-binding protein CopC